MMRVVHFEIHAGDPERAAKFYSDLFGWQIKEWVIEGVDMKPENRYWLVTTGAEAPANAPWPGINGGLLIRRGAAPTEGQAVNAYVCTIDVLNIDDMVAKATSSGGTMALPKMPIVGMGWLAYCKDTEGNLFGMMQADTSAK